MEGAIKAGFGQDPEGGDSFYRLLEKAKALNSPLSTFDTDTLTRFRRTRNRIVHFGFSPKDDNETAGLLLDVGIPFLSGCYQHFFNFDLYDGLVVEISAQLRIARDVFVNQSTGPYPYDATDCCLALGRQIRWFLKPTFMFDWELEAADGAEVNGSKHDVISERKRALELRLEPCWSCDCQICDGFETCVCKLDGDELELGGLKIVSAVCAECGLSIPSRCSALAQMLCGDAVNADRKRILSEYGIG
jgi:hypothetical protein